MASRKIWILLSALVVSACSSIAHRVTSERISFRELQNLGGIQVSARVSGRDVQLDVNCDVSGLTTITTKPKSLNSGLAFYKLMTVVHDNAIQLAVITSVASPELKTVCEGTHIQNLAPGSYKIYYEDSDKQLTALGNFEIKI